MRLPPESGPGGRRALILVAVLLVALNLRSGIASVPPLLPQLQDDLAMSAAAAGLVTTIPVLCFAVIAPVVALAAHRTGVDATLVSGCLLLGLGSVLRVADGTPLLLAATVLIGAGITAGNVLVPVVVRRDLAGRTGHVTGLYIAAMTAGAMLAAATSVPLASNWGWRRALALWAVPAVLAALAWVVARHRTATPAVPAAANDPGAALAGSTPASVLWRSTTAWGLALFLGAQAACYYSMTTWLPSMLVDEAAVSPGTAGAAMSAFQALGIAGALAIPMLTSLRPRQGWLVLLVAGGWLTTVIGLLVHPEAWPVWSAVGGVSQGGGIGLALALVALSAHDVATTRRLSGMVQTLGYLIAAAAPVGIGIVREATGDWTRPLAVLIVLSVVMAAAGLAGCRDLPAGVPAARSSR